MKYFFSFLFLIKKKIYEKNKIRKFYLKITKKKKGTGKGKFRGRES